MNCVYLVTDPLLCLPGANPNNDASDEVYMLTALFLGILVATFLCVVAVSTVQYTHLALPMEQEPANHDAGVSLETLNEAASLSQPEADAQPSSIRRAILQCGPAIELLAQAAKLQNDQAALDY